MSEPTKTLRFDSCETLVYPDKNALGTAAAAFVAGIIRSEVEAKGHARVIFATGASQFEFLQALTTLPLPWDKITAFHLDEYVGLPADHPASFRLYLRERLFDIVKPKAVHLLDGNAQPPEAECERYSALLSEAPVDLACIGIGENGHIAFNDPPVADFSDPELVKIVELDEACRRQQLGEGWFPTLNDVPTHALTLTVPAIMSAKRISCVVPDERKAPAVKAAMTGPIETACPASILRTHDNCRLWLDQPAASSIS